MDELVKIAPYVGGVGLVAIIITAMFLRYLRVMQEGLNNIYSNRMASMEMQIESLENKRSINVSDLYGKISDVKDEITKLNEKISDNYVRKSDCEKRH